jgi:hypothetical protein
MLMSPLLFVMSVLITLFSWTSLAKASEPEVLGLSFALPPTSQQLAAGSAKPQIHTTDDLAAELPSLTRQLEPLPPITAAPQNLPASVSISEPLANVTDQETESLALSFDKDKVQLPTDNLAIATPDVEAATNISSNISQREASQPKVSASSSDKSPSTDPPSTDLGSLFDGGGDSLVARTVGSAEGTRLWNGRRTQAYYGHVDPGNGVWNLGTFSYQHEALTPEEADQKQLQRLKSQGAQLEQQAAGLGIQLSLAERLNGLDLANQAPLAALDQGGYIERLAQARQQGKTGNEAIIWARTHAYIDPATQLWNAPGLGNTGPSIERDQERRVLAVEKALTAYSGGIDLANVPLANIPLATDTQVHNPASVSAEEDFWAAAPTILDNAEGALMIAADGALFRNDQRDDQATTDQPPVATARSAQPALAEDSSESGLGYASDADSSDSPDSAIADRAVEDSAVDELVASGPSSDIAGTDEVDIALVIPPISDAADLVTANKRLEALTLMPDSQPSELSEADLLSENESIEQGEDSNLPIPAPLKTNPPKVSPSTTSQKAGQATKSPEAVEHTAGQPNWENRQLF